MINGFVSAREMPREAPRSPSPVPDSEPERLEYHRQRRERKKVRRSKSKGTDVSEAINISSGSGQATGGSSSSGNEEITIIHSAKRSNIIVVEDDDDDEVKIIQKPDLARFAFKAGSSSKVSTPKIPAASPLPLLPPPESKELLKAPDWLKTTKVLQELPACVVCLRAWKGSKEKAGIGKWVRLLSQCEEGI